MEQGREGPLPHFLRQDRGTIRVSVPCVDDQRQSGLARRSDMSAKHPLRDFARGFVIVIIQPRFAEPNAFRMVGELDKLINGWLYFFM